LSLITFAVILPALAVFRLLTSDFFIIPQSTICNPHYEGLYSGMALRESWAWRRAGFY